jgi:hypothetical protein
MAETIAMAAEVPIAGMGFTAVGLRCGQRPRYCSSVTFSIQSAPLAIHGFGDGYMANPGRWGAAVPARRIGRLTPSSSEGAKGSACRSGVPSRFDFIRGPQDEATFTMAVLGVQRGARSIAKRIAATNAAGYPRCVTSRLVDALGPMVRRPFFKRTPALLGRSPEGTDPQQTGRDVPSGDRVTDEKILLGDLAAHAMMEAVRGQAIEIVALAHEARESRYALIRATFMATAIDMGKEPSQAEAAANQMVEWTRSTVMIIEAGNAPEG